MPLLNNPNLFNKREYSLIKNNNIPRCLQSYQQVAKNFISPSTLYKSLLLFFEVGTGKTLSAIEIAQNFLIEKSNMKIVVLIKNSLIKDNFINEIIYNKCSSYYIDGPQEMNLFKLTPSNFNQREDRNKLISIIKQRILKNYKFITYGEFVNKTLGENQPGKKSRLVKGIKIKNLSNRVIIIDEVHNITRNSDAYTGMINTLKNSINYRIVLLSATPMYNSINEIFKISNLLSDDYSQLPINDDLIKKGYVKTKSNSTEFNKNVLYLTDKGKKELTNALKYKVLYIKSNSTFFPKVSHKGSISGDSTIVFLCDMKPFQKKVYMAISKIELKRFNISNEIDTDIENNSSFLFKRSTDASAIVYPDSTYGKEGFLNNMVLYNTKNNSWKPKSNFLSINNIENYSSKLFHLYKNLQKTKGLSFIYSNFVNHGGITLIKAFLEYNNIKNILVIDDSIESNKRTKLIASFNSDSNSHGEKYKIIIGSPVLSEGITLKNIRQVHIFEPFWNYSKIDQIIGRAVRHMSHFALPETERTVDIFKYVSSGIPLTYNIDLLKYKLSESKDHAIKEVEYIIKRNTIDCNFHKKINENTNKIDYSRECEYELCKYTCEIPKPSNKIDLTTFELKENALYLYKYLKEKILNFFDNQIVGDIKDIYESLSSIDEIPKKDMIKYLKIVINDIVQKQETVYDKGYTLFYVKEGFYIRDKISNSIKLETMNDNSFIIERKELPIKQNISSTIKEEKVLDMRNISSTILTKPIYGTLVDKFSIIDNKFRIVDNRQENSKNLGKVCTFYNIPELVEISTYLGLSIPTKKNKPNLCKGIYEHLLKKNLIIK